MVTSRVFKSISVGFAILASCCTVSLQAATTKPNIVVIVADDLGWADVGFRGSPIQTPNLDRLASEGVELSRFYTTPSCSPTRAALMTGRNAFKLGIAYATIMPWSNNGVHPEERFMPEAFRDAGYQTAMFGKWHLGHAQETYHPNQRGFDHFYGHLHTEVGFYPPFSNQGGKDFQRNGVSIDDKGYETFMLVDEAATWLSKRDQEEPFFIYLPFLAPHSPLDAPQEFKDKYRDLEDNRGPARSPVDQISEMARKAGRATSKRQIYAAVVDAMDHAIGNLMATLEEEGVADNTIILFMSDNGGQSIFGSGGADNSPLRGGKGEVFEGGIRNVSLMHWPQKIEGGQQLQQIVSVMDVFPTLAAAAGIETGASKALDGINMLPAIIDGIQVPRAEPLFFAQESPNFGSFKHTLLDEEWKLIQLVDQDLEQITIKNMLFNIKQDPYEYKDVTAEHPERVAQMASAIRHWRSQYIVSGTRANLVPPPGWRAPLDWVNYPVPVEQLQAEAAPGMLKGASKQLMQRSLGERGRLVYD
ncbi:MAG: sulfatase-like hydrolase/transferase [Halioglobus sp.]